MTAYYGVYCAAKWSNSSSKELGVLILPVSNKRLVSLYIKLFCQRSKLEALKYMISQSFHYSIEMDCVCKVPGLWKPAGKQAASVSSVQQARRCNRVCKM
ncbi:hypothetical protein ISCGN_022241 [Ixodes scapularis]